MRKSNSSGLFHDSRRDVNTLMSVCNELIKTVNKLIDEVNTLKDNQK